jgi:hypothetical protein
VVVTAILVPFATAYVARRTRARDRVAEPVGSRD